MLYLTLLISKVYFNGRERTNTKTLKSNSGYKFYDSGELEKNIKQSVSYCAVQLIFEEPSGIDKVYSEETGAFHSLTKIASHSYSKENEKEYGIRSIHFVIE